MTPTPEVKPLSRKHRRIVFALSLALFATVLPLLVFYAVGYRIDFSGETRNIRTVGGMYLSADADNVNIFIDEKPVKDMRIFQNAAYIQNLDAGLHQVHVQGEGINTWVKNLPVQSHFVTEVASFNVPTTSQLRIITPFLTDSGESVLEVGATSTFATASTSNTFYATSSTATSSLVVNPEFVYLSTLFASSTEERLLRNEIAQINAERFQFASASDTLKAIEVSTTTKKANDIELRKAGEEVVAFWTGSKDSTPYYYCLTYTGEMSTALAYGTHVYKDVVDEFASTTDLSDKSMLGKRLCRSSIKLDRKYQSIIYFDFVPGRDDLVLLQLQDGVYVTEIDDRSWQNMQLLYPGDYLEVLVENGSIYVKDGDYIMEVFTDLQG